MRRLSLVNLLAFIAVVTVNYLSNALPLNGKTPGELSDQYPNLFVPAGLTFAIWGVIYLWLLLWAGAQAVALFHPRLAARLSPGVEKVGYRFALSCALNIAWLLAWHWEQVALSLAIMVGLLTVLWQMNQAAEVGLFKTDPLEKWLAHAPFGIYQGWLTIALIANVTALLVSMGWTGGGLSEATWAIALIFTGTLLATTVVRQYNNVFHGLAVAWALFGIFLKQRGNADADLLPLSTVALAGAALILFWVAVRWQRWHAY